MAATEVNAKSTTTANKTPTPLTKTIYTLKKTTYIHPKNPIFSVLLYATDPLSNWGFSGTQHALYKPAPQQPSFHLPPTISS